MDGPKANMLTILVSAPVWCKQSERTMYKSCRVKGDWRQHGFSQAEKKELLAKLSKFTKRQLFSLKMVLGCLFE